MTLVLVALAVGYAFTVAVFLRALQRQAREHGRRLDLLVNQLLHAAGRTWQPPPADAPEVPQPGRWSEYTSHPEAVDWNEEVPNAS